jgi:hypothetical protein
MEGGAPEAKPDEGDANVSLRALPVHHVNEARIYLIASANIALAGTPEA